VTDWRGIFVVLAGFGLRAGVAVVHHVRDIRAEAKKIKPCLDFTDLDFAGVLVRNRS